LQLIIDEGIFLSKNSNQLTIKTKTYDNRMKAKTRKEINFNFEK
jgi:hypothetical protein